MRATTAVLLAISALSLLVSAAPTPLPEAAAPIEARAGTKVQFDCANKLGNCANACFAANCGSKAGVSLALTNNLSKASSGDLTYGGTGLNTANRKVSGYSFTKTKGGADALVAAGVDQGGVDDTSPDEWPPASTKEGGPGASLRLVPFKEQQSQGGQTYKNSASPLHYYELTDWKYVFLDTSFWSILLTPISSKIPECVAYQSGDISQCKTNKKQFHYVSSSNTFVIGM
jgi:hypothetical protein